MAKKRDMKDPSQNRAISDVPVTRQDIGAPSVADQLRPLQV